MTIFIFQVSQLCFISLDLKTAESLEILTREGITHVVNLIAHKQVGNNTLVSFDNLPKINKP